MASAPAPTVPTTFQHFPKLAFELRETIWNIAVSQLAPRIVHILHCGEVYTLSSRNALPALFAVCKQSRAVAAKYHLQLLPPHNTPDLVFFNPEIDTLLFQHDPLPRDALFPLGSGPRIQNIISITDLNRVKNLCFIYACPLQTPFLSEGEALLAAGDLNRFVVNCDVFESVETVAFATNYDEVESDLLSGVQIEELDIRCEAAKVYMVLLEFESLLRQRHEKAFPGLKLPIMRFLPLNISFHNGRFVEPRMADNLFIRTKIAFRIGGRRTSTN
jgi:hypothetical protein